MTVRIVLVMQYIHQNCQLVTIHHCTS